jgi:hypothetical protein
MPAKENNDDSAIQSGSVVVDNSKEDYRVPSEAAEAGESGKGQEPSGVDSTGDDTGAQSGQGSQDSKVDSTDAFSEKLAAKLDELNNSIKSMGQTEGSGQETAQESGRDYDQELLELQEKANEGEISYSELIAQSQAIQEAKTQDLVSNALSEYEQRQQVTGMQQKFLAENPDYGDFVNSQENQMLQESNPVLDNLSSYYAYKATSAAQEAEALRQELAQLKEQYGTSVKGAAGQQLGKIGGESGSDLRRSAQQSKENLTPREGMLAALRLAREQRG